MAKIRAMIGIGGSQPTETVLWTNPSPTADFESQPVNLTKNGVAESIQNYDYIKVTYKFSKSDADSTAVSALMSVADFTYCTNDSTARKPKFVMGAKLDNYSNARFVFYATDTTVKFGSSARCNQSGFNAAYVTPLKIIGVKL